MINKDMRVLFFLLYCQIILNPSSEDHLLKQDNFRLKIHFGSILDLTQE